jgi:superfamily II DNA or RNA helicase
MMKTKEEYLQELEVILTGEVSVKLFCNTIQQIREGLSLLSTSDEMETVASRVKTRVQAEAITAWNNNGRWGAIVGATGIGKSKMGVDIVSDVLRKNPEAKELIVVPTAKLRDDNWPSEFEKWGVEVPDGTLKLSCYASLPNIRGHEISVAIMDEGHNMTESNMSGSTL